MGVLLKEVLRRLCVEGGWSYGVFWKIGRRNPAHLVWGEGHYETTGISGLSNLSRIEIVDPLCKEQETGQDTLNDRLSQLACQVDDGLSRMINKMMLPQIHVVGSGIVGCAASTGNHQWIFRETLGRDEYLSMVSVDCRSISKDLAEMNQQFTTGIQTIALIPVLPHGVVQLGSIQMVMESVRFVNHVKILFMQLGSVPGAFFSENIKKDLGQKVQVNASYGVPTLTPVSINTHSEQAIGERFKRQTLKTPPSSIAIEPSWSSTQFNASSSTNSSEASSTSKGIMTSKDIGDFIQIMPSTIVKPLLSHGDQVETGPTTTKTVLLHPHVQLKQQGSPFSMSSDGRQWYSSGLTCDNLTLMEQQLFSATGSGIPANNIPILTEIPQAGHLRGTVASSAKDSVIISLLGENESSNNVINLGTSNSLPFDAWRSMDSDSFLESTMVQSGQSSPRMFNPADNHNNGYVTSEESQRTHVSSIKVHATVASMREQDTDVLQNTNVLSIDSDDPVWIRNMPGFLEECSLNGSQVIQGDQSCHGVCEGIGVSMEKPWKSIGEPERDSLYRSHERPSGALVRPSIGDELFEALCQGFKFGSCGNLNDVIDCPVDLYTQNLNMEFCTSMTEIDMDTASGLMIKGVPNGGIFSEMDHDHLLEAVVSKVHSNSKQNSEDGVSCKTTLTNISSASLHTNCPPHGQVASEEKIQRGFVGLSPALVKVDTARLGSVASACSTDTVEDCFQMAGGPKSQISLWAEGRQQYMKPDNISVAPCKRPDEPWKSNRKRSRPGENPRPRPKDRQMIQDRVKELREIVPNGAKCSVDLLLERTIKHMLFLQSVSKHADKLKETGEPKIKEGGLVLKDNFEGGATWAFEIGTQSIICPIIVEDLNPPRQMLVEMLCEDRGFFLEIADLIRGLGLTILKGVMEARNDKVWARFSVEANRDVTRMEIFLSLVHILEPTLGTISTLQKDLIDGSNAGLNVFHQPSMSPLLSEICS